MRKPRSRKTANKTEPTRTLVVQLDKLSKAILQQAAQLRKISISDDARLVTVGQARREVEGAGNNIPVMTAEEQLAFWNALNEATPLTEAKRRLGATMRGEQ
jgi:hypothetical protein